MNRVVLVGNLTKDPELTTTGSGVSLCRFAIAVNRNFTSASGERDADFFNIVAWRNLADNCGKFLAKGKKVAVSGRIENRTVDSGDGNKRYYTDIIADDVEFLSPRGEGGEPMANRVPVTELKPVDSDELPF
ncbi:MAG: single-stranded DNA-binding protein [Firmicutes bacterium]|nr:single-stranded DNA-binding protein [Bacillota bacterium]